MSVTASLTDLLASSVVEIRTRRGGGSGIVWREGLIVTNAHCVPNGGTVRVNAAGQSHTGELVAYAREHDLALLRVPLLADTSLERRSAESIRVGELVFAHGHPLGVRNALAMGVIHAVARHPRSGEPRFVVVDVRLAPGNSGGPLVDAHGRLLGVNTMVVDGLGVAVPTDAITRFVERARAKRVA